MIRVLIAVTVFLFADDSLIETVKKGNTEFFKLGSIASSLPNTGAFQEGETFTYVSGINYPLWNGVISEKNPTPSEMAEKIAYFENLKLPFAWWTETNLESYGFIYAGTLTGISLDISKNLPKDPNSSHIVQKMVDPTDHNLSKLVVEVFGMKNECIEELHSSVSGSMKDMVHFIAYKEGKAVGSATLHAGETAGIWNLTTLPEYRRQGVATALVYEAIKEAKARSYMSVMALLMPKGMAWGVFERLGFKSVCLFPFYTYGSTDPLE